MEYELAFKSEFENPARALVCPVKINLALRHRRQIMREALELERGSATHYETHFEERLQGDDDAFPRNSVRGLLRQFGSRPAIYAAGDSVEPPTRDVFVPQSAGIAILFEPTGVSDQPFRQGSLQQV